MPPTPQQARAILELRARARLRTSFAEFARTALPTIAPEAKAPAAHHELLIRELQHVADTPGSRLMVFMPPGSAKSTYGSVLFPAWLMRRPHFKLIQASHTAQLAETWSGRAQRVIRDYAVALDVGFATEAKSRWVTNLRSEYLAVGTGGAVAGFRADCIIIDDPVKSAEAADSGTQRESLWNWYTSDLVTRLKPEGRIVLIMTRWHMDDLAGRIIQYANPGEWRIIEIPALARSSDPLGREPGTALWDDDGYGYGSKLFGIRDKMQREGKSRAWSALYQQEPRPAEGLLFQASQIEAMDAAPADGRVVRAWDLAASVASSSDPDWTVGVRIRRTALGRFIVEDVRRLRGGPDAVEAAILSTARADGQSVTIGLPQDPGQAGKSQVLSLTRMLAGFSVHSSPETGSKETRAGPVAAQCNVGNLAVIRAPWNAAFIEELRDFPTGRKDDQVDALSRAFGMLIAAAGPIRVLRGVSVMGR